MQISRIRFLGAWARYVAYRGARRGVGSGKRSSSCAMRFQEKMPSRERVESHLRQVFFTSWCMRLSEAMFAVTPKYA